MSSARWPRRTRLIAFLSAALLALIAIIALSLASRSGSNSATPTPTSVAPTATPGPTVPATPLAPRDYQAYHNQVLSAFNDLRALYQVYLARVESAAVDAPTPTPTATPNPTPDPLRDAQRQIEAVQEALRQRRYTELDPQYSSRVTLADWLEGMRVTTAALVDWARYFTAVVPPVEYAAYHEKMTIAIGQNTLIAFDVYSLFQNAPGGVFDRAVVDSAELQLANGRLILADALKQSPF